MYIGKKEAHDIHKCVQSNEQYQEGRCKAFTCDLTADALTDNIPAASLDLVSALFVFSAIPSEKMEAAIKNIYKVLKPGGCVLFRDYGLYDEAQIKFSVASDKKLDDNLYVRQDGKIRIPLVSWWWLLMVYSIIRHHELFLFSGRSCITIRIGWFQDPQERLYLP